MSRRKHKHPELSKNCYNCNNCEYIGEGRLYVQYEQRYRHRRLATDRGF